MIEMLGVYIYIKIIFYKKINYDFLVHVILTINRAFFTCM